MTHKKHVLILFLTELSTKVIIRPSYKPFLSYRHNTWEPEHNLNCPSILKAFFEKHGLDSSPPPKKRKLKKKKRILEQTPPKESEPEISTTTTAVTTTKEKEAGPSVELDAPVVLTEEERDIEEAGRLKAEKKLRRQKRREEKRLNKLLEEREAWEKANAENKKAKEDAKKRLTIAQGTNLIEKAKQLNEKESVPSEQQKAEEKERLEEERRLLAEKRQVDEIKKANALRKAEMDYQKANAQRRAEEEEESTKIVSTKPYHPNNQRLSKTDESFTAIKRTVNAKPPPSSTLYNTTDFCILHTHLHTDILTNYSLYRWT